MGVHKCTPEDWNNFAQPSQKSNISFHDLKDENEMLCINGTDIYGHKVKTMLYGNGAHTPHRHLEIVYMPCMPKRFNESNTSECLMDDPTNAT